MFHEKVSTYVYFLHIAKISQTNNSSTLVLWQRHSMALHIVIDSSRNSFVGKTGSENILSRAIMQYNIP